MSDIKYTLMGKKIITMYWIYGSRLVLMLLEKVMINNRYFVFWRQFFAKNKILKIIEGDLRDTLIKRSCNIMMFLYI